MSESEGVIRSAIDASNDPDAASKLLPLMYDELRRLAQAHIAHENPGRSIQATALVHEAYIRLLGPQGAGSHGWEGRRHFFAAAAEAMRRILVDRARARGAVKRGGEYQRLDLNPATLLVDEVPDELLDLDEALTKFEEVDAVKAELVRLRFFGGLTIQQAARLLDMSSSTADRAWAYARAWLFAALQDDA